MARESTKNKLRKAIEAIEAAKLTSNDVMACSCGLMSAPDLFVHEEALIRIYHMFKVPRSAIQAEIVDGYVHIKVPAKGVTFSGCIKLEKAAQFIDSKQGQLPAPRAKRVRGSEQRKLAFAGNEE